MSLMSVLQPLLLLFAILSQSKRIHKCLHDNVHKDIDLRQTFVNYKNHPYDEDIIGINIGEAPQRRLAATQARPSPIRIRPYYDPKYISTDNNLTMEQINYIKSLISTVTRFYQQFVSVIPVENNLFIHRKCTSNYTTEFGINCIEYLKPDQCAMVDIPSDHLAEDLLYFWDGEHNTTATKLPAGAGIPDTDLVIYVSFAQTRSCGESTLAWAAPCFQDQFGRPIAGTVNICPYIFEAEQFWKQDVVVLLHEITHVVIMGPPLWHHFRDSTGDIIPHSNVVSGQQSDGLMYITTPNVVNFARNHFSCQELIGFPLENTGSGGSAGSHWDEHYGMSLLMGSTIWGGLQYFTNLTFSLMADSGWYFVDFKYSEPFHWGAKSGCSFFNNDCIDWRTGRSNWPQYFCDHADDNGCFYNNDAPADCEYYYHNSELPWFLQYFTDSTHGGPEAADYCPFRDPHLHISDFEAACWDKRGNTLLPIQYSAEIYGTNSRCVDIKDGNGETNGHCFEHKCFGYDAALRQWSGVEIFISNQQHINCTRNEEPDGISVTNKYWHASNVHIRCPNIDAICSATSNPFGCYWGNWNDADNACICSPGYSGLLCDEKDIQIGDEIVLESATKAPTASPTEPLSEVLCVENFSALELNDEYIYDGIWNFYPRYRSPNTGLYVFWNIFSHWWMIYDEYDTLNYYALCNVSEFTPDITHCNGEWKVYNSEYAATFRESYAVTYYGLCYQTTMPPTPYPSPFPTLSPTPFPTPSPNILPSRNPTHSPIPIANKSPTSSPSSPQIPSPTPPPSSSPSESTSIFVNTRTSAPIATTTSTEIAAIISSTDLPSVAQIESAEIVTTMETESSTISEIEMDSTMPRSTNVTLERETSIAGGGGMSDAKPAKETIYKGIDWIAFLFEGYIGYIFVSVLSLILLLLILIASSVVNCGRWGKNYGYVGIEVVGGDKGKKNVICIENEQSGESEESEESDEIDEYDESDFDGEDEYEYEQDVIQTITSDLL